MTAILFDGFDHGDEAHRWTTVNHPTDTSPVRTGTHSLQFGSGIGNITTLALDATEEDDVMYVGFGFNSATGTNITICELSEAFGAVSHLSLIRMGGIRGWTVRRGAGWTGDPANQGTELLAPTPNVWFPDSWHYIEFGAKIHDTTGWVELRQDGVAIARFDGDTRNGGTDALIDQVGFTHLTNSGIWNLDDVYILNEQGSVNNSWLGDTRCFPLYPNGNGNYSQLNGSDGDSTDNYLLVDEVGPPVTTDYVAETTVGDKDTYTFEDLPVTLGTIRGVEVRMHAAKDDTGTKQMRSVTRRSATDAFGADKVLAAIPLYQTHTEMQEQDPHAGPGAWTIANVNGTEWGVEVRA